MKSITNGIRANRLVFTTFLSSLLSLHLSDSNFYLEIWVVSMFPAYRMIRLLVTNLAYRNCTEFIL